MKCSHKKILIGILTVSLIMGSFGTVNFNVAASGGSGSIGGTGGMEGTLSDVFNVVVPTESDRSADQNTLYKRAFDFILDPNGIAASSAGSLTGKNLEPNATVYFENIEQGSTYDYSSTSDGFQVVNKSNVAVDVTLDASLTGMDGVRLTNDKDFTYDNSASAYLALTDSKGKEAAIDKFGAVIKTTLKGQPDAYNVIYDGSYKYQLKSDAVLTANNIKFDDYTFRLTGACNSASSWSKLSGYLSPEVSVTWHVALRPKKLAPSIPKNSYVMNKGKAVFVGVDLGAGSLAASGIKSITYLNSSGVTTTLASSNYVFSDDTLRFRAAYISGILEEGVESRNYTITFNDAVGTRENVLLVKNDESAPSITQTEYTMIAGKPVLVDIDLGAGTLGASGITSITFVNPTNGITKTMQSDNYTFANGVLTFKDSYIDMMLSNGITSRKHIITLNDKAQTKFSVTLSVDGKEPSITQTEYRMERGTDVEVAVDLGTESLAASGISSITFISASGATKTLQADNYTFVNNLLTFKADFIDMLFANGIASRAFTVNFDNVTATSVVVTLAADDIEPSNSDVTSIMESGQPVLVNVDLGSGTLGASDITSITFVNPTNGVTKTLLTDKYTFADGVLTFNAAYIDMLLSNGVTSRTHVVTLNNKANTQMKVTLEADGTGPSVAQADYTMERGKSIEVTVDLGAGTLGASNITSITFVNPTNGATKTLLTDKYTFANSILTFKDSFIDVLLDDGVVSRIYTITFDDIAKTQIKVTLKAPDVAPTIDIKEYTMVSDQAINVQVNVGSGSLRATGITSITYMDGTTNKTVPTTYYTFVNGILKIRASYVNGVINGGIASREYTITFNDANKTKEVIKLQK